MTRTRKTNSILLAASSAVILPAAAWAALSTGDVIGTAEEDIRAALTADGYEVHEIEVEDDEIEVEASRDGQLYEIELSADTGTILEIELED